MFPGQPNIPYTLIYCKALLQYHSNESTASMCKPRIQHVTRRSFTKAGWTSNKLQTNKLAGLRSPSQFPSQYPCSCLLWTSHGICAGLNQYPSIRGRLRSTCRGQILHLLVWRPRGALKHINYTLHRHKNAYSLKSFTTKEKNQTEWSLCSE